MTDISFTPSNKSFPPVPSHTFEHLSCFLPGLLALGASTLDFNDPSSRWFDKEQRELHLWAAEGLAYSCWLSYADQSTGLGPDEMDMAFEPVVIPTPEVTGWDPATHTQPTPPPKAKGLWIDLVDEWKKKGKPFKRPPGLREVPPEVNPTKRGYSNRKASYLLRPEVGSLDRPELRFPDLSLSADDRKLLYLVEDHGG